VPFRGLVGRTHVGHLNNLMPADMLRAGYEELAKHAAEGRITVETQRFSLEEAAQAWKAQADGPHHKIAVAP
jgi:threonine dehydrogenase-like Zn-dependent dehydrogenase